MILIDVPLATLADPKMLFDATGTLGFPTVAALILLLTVCGILMLLAAYLIKFLSNIVAIRREIVTQVTKSHTELETLTLELKGLRSDTRELFKILYGIFGKAMYEAYAGREVRYTNPHPSVKGQDTHHQE